MSEPVEIPGRRATSVIIVTRDRADVLPRCLESIAGQQPAPDEVVIVRGNEQSFPDQLRDQFKHLSIKVLECMEPNISLARNIGMEHATGEVIAFIDDDAIAHPNWLNAFSVALDLDPHAWIAGGTVLDARESSKPPEFMLGHIHPCGRQIEVVESNASPVPRGYLASVKGCSFALRMDRVPSGLRFDPFFRFAFDENDLVLTIHEQGGGVIHVPESVVEHLHAPGAYRSKGAMDRDWATEFASHTRFMRKHTSGTGRLMGWGVVLGRLCVHSCRACWTLMRGQIGPGRAMRCVLDAISGIRRGASSRDSD
ncbi:MAG: glycosyltransferase family 2 protein [Phycisphaerales bacterium JB052]